MTIERILVRQCLYCGKIERSVVPVKVAPCPHCRLYGACDECVFLGKVPSDTDLFLRGTAASTLDGQEDCPRKIRRRCFFYGTPRTNAEIKKMCRRVLAGGR